MATEVGQILKGDDVVRTLNRSKSKRRVPKLLFCDNGSEFTSQALDLWAYQNGVKIDCSRPGKPTDNAFVESFNGTFRAECLDARAGSSTRCRAWCACWWRCLLLSKAASTFGRVTGPHPAMPATGSRRAP